ncbi:hypothetical protein V8C86DRAFT_623586 [Haematococcus lacustris]
MHRAMLVVLAALPSLPICPHPQHPHPAATTHTSTIPQLSPGLASCQHVRVSAACCTWDRSFGLPVHYSNTYS